MQPYFFAFREIAIARMFQNQKYSGDTYGLPFNWTKWFRGKQNKRKRVRIMKLEKSSFVSDVKLRNNEKLLKNVYRYVLKNPLPSTPQIWLLRKEEVLLQIKTEGISRIFPTQKMSSDPVWNFLTLSNIDFSYNTGKNWKSSSMSI